MPQRSEAVPWRRSRTLQFGGNRHSTSLASAGIPAKPVILQLER
jgi:hypothetical protein